MFPAKFIKYFQNRITGVWGLQQDKMSVEAAKPKHSFLPCVRTPAVLAVLSNLISADICALSLSKNESAFFIEIFVQRRTNAKKMTVEK